MSAEGGNSDPGLRWRMRAGEDVRSALDRAARLLSSLESCLDGAASQTAIANRRIAMLEQQLAEMDDDRLRLASRVVDAEQESSRLLTLYAATYQLHAAHEPGEVLGTVAEIALNLLGADGFALLLHDEARELRLTIGRDVPEAFGTHLDDHGRYRGGDPLVDATLGDGVMRMAAGEGVLVAVPLCLRGELVGVLAILHVLDHRGPIGEADRELLELLSTQAATALHTARLHAHQPRKLRALAASG